jgi:hypothetical protein
MYILLLDSLFHMTYAMFLLLTSLLCASDRVQSWASLRELVVVVMVVVVVVIYCGILRVKRPWEKFGIRSIITNRLYISLNTMFCVGIPKRRCGENFLKSCFDRLSRIMQMPESVWGGETQTEVGGSELQEFGTNL